MDSFFSQKTLLLNHSNDVNHCDSMLQVPLLRSSQPLNGSSNKRSKEDQKLLALFLQGFISKGLIVDTRQNQSAISSRGRGRYLNGKYLFFIFFVMYCLLFKKGFLKFHKSPLEWFHHICTMKYIRNR